PEHLEIAQITQPETATIPTSSASGRRPHESRSLPPAHPRPRRAAVDDTARDGGAQRAELINDVAGLRDEWQRVPGTFVGDPQRAVHERTAR
ncbi:MAG: hypothetical protein M3143_07565, partial [Actinomycetota bacterium]|nr:hypothetical protein [Actinomycetota bacterium]